MNLKKKNVYLNPVPSSFFRICRLSTKSSAYLVGDYAFARSVLYSRHTATSVFFLAVAGRARRRGKKKILKGDT